MLTLYNVVSSDGFISRIDGSEDFIPDETWPYFLNLCKDFGSLIMGRKTYDIIQKYPTELLESFEVLPIKKIVVSSDKNFNLKKDYILAPSPEAAMDLAPDALVSSGPTLNDYLIKKGLVNKIILYKVTAVIEEGIKPFDEDISSIQIIQAP